MRLALVKRWVVGGCALWCVDLRVLCGGEARRGPWGLIPVADFHDEERRERGRERGYDRDEASSFVLSYSMPDAGSSARALGPEPESRIRVPLLDCRHLDLPCSRPRE